MHLSITSFLWLLKSFPTGDNNENTLTIFEILLQNQYNSIKFRRAMPISKERYYYIDEVLRSSSPEPLVQFQR